MPVTPFHNPREGKLRVVAFMSGSGTNIRRLLELERKLDEDNRHSPFEVVAIFSNDIASKAVEIGKDFAIPVLIHDMRAWYKRKGESTRDMRLRHEYDSLTVAMLAPFKAKVAAYGGYMAVATDPLIDEFIGVNVHPADLSIKAGAKRKYTGDHAVLDAIAAGEKCVRSSTHIVEAEVDTGRLLFISSPVAVELPTEPSKTDKNKLKAIAAEHQDRLKERGDWIIFPKTIEEIARGKFGVDETGRLFYEGKPAPDGVRLGD